MPRAIGWQIELPPRRAADIVDYFFKHAKPGDVL